FPRKRLVIPAKAFGIRVRQSRTPNFACAQVVSVVWIPAFAGTTEVVVPHKPSRHSRANPLSSFSESDPSFPRKRFVIPRKRFVILRRRSVIPPKAISHFPRKR